MIKRKNKLLVGVLSFLLTVTVGYALFSEELRINGVANASGTFELSYSCYQMERSYENNDEGEGFCTPSEGTGDHIMLTSSFKKPTDTVGFAIDITNTGSIPVLLKEAHSPNNIKYYGYSEVGDEMYLDRDVFLTSYYSVYNQKNGDDFMGDSAVANAKITLEPGEQLTIFVNQKWEDEENQPAVPEGGATMNYDLTFDFVQASV